MSLIAAEIEKQPTVACIGIIKKVEKLRVGKDGTSPYHVIDVVLEPIAAPIKRDQKVFLTFKPEWFDAQFDGKSFTGENDSLVYRSNVAYKGRKKGLLQAAMNGHFGELVASCDQLNDPSAEEVFQVIQNHLVGRQVGYTLVQQKEKNEETGQKEITDQIVVGQLFDHEAVEYYAEQERKDPTKVQVAWEINSKPLG